MSKLVFTASGAAGVAASVPLMHFLGKAFTQSPQKEVSRVSTTGLFLASWVILAMGLRKPPPGAVVDESWKTRQTILSVAGVSSVVAGVAMLRYVDKIPFPVGAAMYVAGWAALTASFIFSDPDYQVMAREEKSGRVIQAVVASMVVISGTVVMRQDSPMSQVLGSVMIALGLLDVVAVSALQ